MVEDFIIEVYSGGWESVLLLFFIALILAALLYATTQRQLINSYAKTVDSNRLMLTRSLADISELNKRIHTMTDRVHNSETRQNSLEQANVALQSKNEELIRENAKYKQYIKTLVIEVNTEREKIKKMQAEIDELRQKLADYENAL